MRLTPTRFLLISVMLLPATYLIWLGGLAWSHSREIEKLDEMRSMSSWEVHDPPQVSRMQSILARPLLHFRPKALERVYRIELNLRHESFLVEIEDLSAFPKLEDVYIWPSFPGFTNALHHLHQIKPLRLEIRWDSSWGNPMALDGFPITRLEIDGPVDGRFRLPVGLPIRDFTLQGPVHSSLEFIEGLPLEKLTFWSPRTPPKEIRLDIKAFERMAALPLLQKLHIEGDSDTAFSQAGLDALADCPALVELRINGCTVTSVAGMARVGTLRDLRLEAPPDDLSPLVESGVTSLTLENASVGHLESLAGAVHLTRLNVAGDAFALVDDDRLNKALDHLPSLNVVFFNFKIAKSTFENLRDRGIRPWHEGVKDHQLEQNYMRVSENYWQVALSDSQLVTRVDADTGRLTIQVAIKTRDPYQSRGNYCHASADSPEFVFSAVDSPVLADRVSTNALALDANGYRFRPWVYYCSYGEASNNQMELLSLANGVLHLNWDFDIDAKVGRIDVELPLESVLVRSSVPLTREKAKASLETHFPSAKIISTARINESEFLFRLHLEDAP